MTETSKRRNTVQRKIILDTLRPMRSHPTIEELYVEVAKQFPTISKTTLYRNLRILAVNGQVLRILLPDGLERYDGQIHNHYHFQCNKCELIFDVEIDYLSNIEDVVAKQYGFEILGHDVIFKGFCKGCRTGKVTNA